MNKNFIREKKIFCGEDYLEVDIIPKAASERTRKGKRSKKVKLSVPKQRNLNDKNAKRYFTQLVNSNFGWGDLRVDLTYSDEELPPTIEDGEREARNFMRRVNYRMEKEGLPSAKYIIITEGTTEKEGNKATRIHHHIFISAGLDRDTIESIWSRRRRKGEKEGRRIGYANADRLQPNEYGLEELAQYLSKDPKGKKRWISSQNLLRPEMRNNDNKYSKRKVEKIARNPEDRIYWEKQYPGYWLTECKAVFNDITGWSIYLKMRRGGRRYETPKG